jgi:hypothetical protein
MQQLADALKGLGIFEVAVEGLPTLGRDHFQDIVVAHDTAGKGGCDTFDSHWQSSPGILKEPWIASLGAAIRGLAEGCLPGSVHIR